LAPREAGYQSKASVGKFASRRSAKIRCESGSVRRDRAACLQSARRTNPKTFPSIALPAPANAASHRGKRVLRLTGTWCDPCASLL